MEKNDLLITPHLIYVMDPLCAWCYGFAPVIRRLKEEQKELKFKLVMGGLRPGATTPLETDTNENVREHWEEVAHTTGQPFDYSFFDRRNFVFDTEPACRAVVSVRYLSPERELEMSEEIQRAFYAQNNDVTKPEVLAGIAATLDVQGDAFNEKFYADLTVEKTQQDFMIARQLRAIALPSLYLLNEKRISLISRGYKNYEAVKSRLEEALYGPLPT